MRVPFTFFFKIDLVALLFDSSSKTGSYNQSFFRPISKCNGWNALILQWTNPVILGGGFVDYGPKSIWGVWMELLGDAQVGGIDSLIMDRNLQSFCYVPLILGQINCPFWGDSRVSARGLLSVTLFFNVSPLIQHFNRQSLTGVKFPRIFFSRIFSWLSSDLGVSYDWLFPTTPNQPRNITYNPSEEVMRRSYQRMPMR